MTMKVNGVIQVRTPVRNLYNPAEYAQSGSKVEVRLDPHLYAQAAVRKAVARAVAAGKPMHHMKQKALYNRIVRELTEES